MSFAKVHSIQPHFPKPQLIEVEVDVSVGLFQFTIIGLPDKAIAEARDRVIAAIKNSGFPSPKTKNHKITVSLAPSSIRKTGTHLDLAIAVGYLLASGTISFNPAHFIFMAELSLDGSLKPGAASPCIEPFASFKAVFTSNQQSVPKHSSLALPIWQASHLRSVVQNITDRKKWNKRNSLPTETQKEPVDIPDLTFFNYLANNSQLLRFAEICAAGGLHTLLYGPPGSGKTLLAHAIHELLPQLNEKQYMGTASLYAATGLVHHSTTRPFRKPHHTSSYSTLIGSASSDTLGEVTLSSHGILLLDELPEFNRRVLESLREPLENREYGRDPLFQCIATMNLCPCGNLRSNQRACSCNARTVTSYQARVSGPLLERFHVGLELTPKSFSLQGHLEVKRLATEQLFRESRNRIQIAQTRLVECKPKWTGESHSLFLRTCAQRSLSLRGHRTLEYLCATVAALDLKPTIQKEHLDEALLLHVSNLW